MASAQYSTVDSPVSKKRLIILSFPESFSLFPRTFLIRNVDFTPQKIASALRKFKMAIKQRTLASFHFINLSNDQDKTSPSTSGENTNACPPSIPYALGPQKIL